VALSMSAAFTILTASSKQFICIGPGSITGVTEIAGYRLNLNAPSNQAGVG
jgi:hypothetical protein